MKREVIVACDFQDPVTLMSFLERFGSYRPYIKIGMEIFYGNGPQIVRRIKDRGHRIFLDLKLHDIPNTVYKSMLKLAELDVDMVNVHAAGTIEMMRAARRALAAGCDGVVCSPLEVDAVRAQCGENFVTVTPGIRFADDDKGDQKRVTTPARARELGSSFVVIGRSITGAADPVAAWLRAVHEFEGETV